MLYQIPALVASRGAISLSRSRRCFRYAVGASGGESGGRDELNSRFCYKFKIRQELFVNKCAPPLMLCSQIIFP